MASREETLLFIVDVQVRNANALRALDADMAATFAAQDRRLLALGESASEAAGGHEGLAAAMAAVADTSRSSGPALIPAAGGGRGPTVVQVHQQQDPGTAIWGVRGPKNPGSRMNPMGLAAESAAASGLGSLAAPTGDQSGSQAPPIAVAPAQQASPDRQWLADAAKAVAAKVMAPEDDRMLAAIQAATQIRSATGESPLLTAAKAVQGTMADRGLVDAIATVQAARSGGARPAGSAPLDLLAAASTVQRAATPSAISPASLAAAAAAVRAAQNPGIGDIAAAAAAVRAANAPAAATLSAAAAAAHLKIPISRVYQMASAGQLAGATKSPSGAWVIPQQAVIDAAAGGGGPPVIPPVARGGGNNGGNNNFLRNLLWGTGMFGLAGFGTLGSFAGLGPEHLLMTGLGILGSAGAAAGGAGMLGLGAAGTIGVGAGSDMAVAASTSADVQLLYKDYTNLSQAIGVYGKNSTQAAQAQAQLNYDIKDTLANTPGVQAELGLAKQLNALNTTWDLTTSHARQLVVQIADQAMSLANTFMPLVVSSAQRNLAIIDNDIRPLFTWLKGPEGIQIWQDLENQFATNLPSAVHAFTQVFEVVARTMDIASQYTGGFTEKIDSLFTRLNSESNIQLGNEVSKLVDDFRLWEHFVVLLIGDIARLFSNDSQTGNSIVSELTTMLEKLKEWENSVQGRQDLMTIFSVHKSEIDTLLRAIPLLIKAFEPIYMTMSPALTTAFTSIASAIEDIVSAIEKIPGGTALLGLGLVLAKVGALATLFKGAGTVLAGGAAATAGAASATGSTAAAVGGGAAAGTSLGLISKLLGAVGSSRFGLATSVGVQGAGLSLGEMLGGGALGEGIAGIGTALAPAVGVIVPIAVAALGAYGGYKLLSALFGGSTPTTSYTTNQLGLLLQQHGAAALGMTATAGESSRPTVGTGRPLATQVTGSPVANTVGELGPTPQARKALQDWVNAVSNSANVAKMSATQMQGMVNEGQALAKIFPQDAQEIDKFTNKVRADLAPLDAVMATIADRWSSALIPGLKTITDLFDSNTRLIAHDVGLNSDQGRQLFAENIQKMVAAVRGGMADGLVGTAAGMKQINEALDAGVKDGALTWQDQWSTMYSTLRELQSSHLISTKTYLSELNSAQDTAVSHMVSGTEANYRSMYAYLKGQMEDGNLTQAAFNSKAATLRSQDAGNVDSYVAGIVAQMAAAGAASAQGTSEILTAANQALKKLGAAGTIGTIALDASAAAATVLGAAKAVATMGKAATGAKIDRPMFLVGEEAPTHPEYVIASNPAYRQRNVKLWAQAGKHLGIPGFAQGGIAAGIAWANAVNAKHYPYEWGGGHLQIGVPNVGEPGGPAGSATGQVGFDCSGTVSGDLHAMGLLGTPMTAAQFMSYGLPGPGPVTIYASPSHVFMSLDGRFFGTHGNSGAGWYAGSPLPGFVERHPPHIGSAQINAPRIAGSGAMASIVRSSLARVAKAANARVTKAMLATMSGGQIGGGDKGTFTGPVAPGSWLQVARELAAKHGWDAAQVQAWQGVENIEDSAYSLTAQNPTSPAYGLAQFIQGASEYYSYGGNPNTLVGQLTAMANYIAQRYGTPSAALAEEHAAGHYAKGGKVGWAGAFGDGGMVTASSPTLAMFGDKGTETAFFLPRYATGGVVGHALAAGSAAPTAGAGYSFISHPTADQYAILNDHSLSAHQKAVALAYLASPGSTSSGSSTSSGKKKPPANPNLSDVLDLLGGHAGSVYQPSKTLGSEKLPKGGAIDLLGSIIEQATVHGFQAILAGLGRYVAGATPSRALTVAGQLTGDIPAHGGDTSRQAQLADKAISAVLSKVTTAFNSLQTTAGNQSSVATALQGIASGTTLRALGLHGAALKATGLSATQARALVGGGGAGILAKLDSDQEAQYKADAAKLDKAYKDAVKTHNTKLQAAILQQLSAVDGAMEQTIAAGQQAIVQKVMGPLANAFTKLQTRSGNQSTMAGLLGGLTPGTRVSLGAAGLKTAGLTGAQVQALIGGGPASYGVLASLDTSATQGYEAQADKLQKAYKKAVKDHNKALQQAILQQLSTVDGAMVQSMAAGQQAIVQEVQATAQAFSDQASAIAASGSVIQAIEALNPGDNLGALGLTPAVLSALGINPNQAGGLVGTSLSYYQGLATSQGGMLTSQQLAGATAGIGAQNQFLASEETPLSQELSYDLSMGPGGLGETQAQFQATIAGLATQILSLQSTIEANNQGLQQLTQATTNNTTATTNNTGAMTGTVSFSYQGQNGYLASDTGMNLRVGT